LGVHGDNLEVNRSTTCIANGGQCQNAFVGRAKDRIDKILERISDARDMGCQEFLFF